MTSQVTTPPHGEGSGHGPFGLQSQLNVSVNAGSVNFNASSLGALERIARDNPSLAEKILDSARLGDAEDTRRYKIGAVCASVVAVTMLLTTGAVVITTGFWAGIAFFLICATVSAIFSTVYTGQTPDLSWSLDFLKAAQSKGKDINGAGPAPGS